MKAKCLIRITHESSLDAFLAKDLQASLKRRLDAARGELDYGRSEGNFDLCLVNDQVRKSTHHFPSYGNIHHALFICTSIILQVEKAYTQLREFILPTISKLDGEGGSGEKFI